MIYLNSKPYNLIKSRRFIWMFSIVVIFYLFVTKTAYANTTCNDAKNTSGVDFKLNTVRYPKEGYKEFQLGYNGFEIKCDSTDVYFKVKVFSNTGTMTDLAVISSISGLKLTTYEEKMFPACSVDSRSHSEIIFKCTNIPLYQPIPMKIGEILIKENSISVNSKLHEDIDYSIEYYSFGETPKKLNTHYSLYFEIKGEIITYGCDLNINNINFDLGEQQLRNSTNTGPVGNGKTQKIALTCDPTTKYSLQVDGDAEPGHQGVLKLSPGSSATGVGVQLLVGKNQAPVEFGKNKQMGIAASSGTNIQEEIDITARYYQTENKATPGTANATASFTMTYQ
ncbi:fimbrial protein [Yersinia proxima]